MVVNAVDVIGRVSRGWNRDPAQIALGSPESGVSAAVWTHGGESPEDVKSDHCFDHHIISLQLAPNRAEVFRDGAHVFTKLLLPGTVQIMRAGVVPRAVQSGAWRLLHLYVPSAIVEQLGAQDVGFGPVEIVDPEGRPDPTIERIGREVLAEMRAEAPLSRLRIDVLGQELAIQLLRSHSNLPGGAIREDAPWRQAARDWRLRRVLELIDARLGEDISLAELALEAGLSAKHLTTLFRAATGEPPHRWLMRRRVERAREMLANPRHSVTEVAHLCGFASSQHLATVFQKRLGMTPSAYRHERLG